MFKKAAKLKVRFTTPIGILSAEDLFDLPLQHSSAFSLDDLAKSLNKLLKASEEESFVTETTTASLGAKLMFDIVIEVIKVKKDDRDTALAAKDRREKKQKLLELIANKDSEDLAGKSREDLQAMLDEL